MELRGNALFHGAFGFPGLLGGHSCFSGKSTTLRGFRNSKHISKTVQTPNFGGRMRGQAGAINWVFKDSSFDHHRKYLFLYTIISGISEPGLMAPAGPFSCGLRTWTQQCLQIALWSSYSQRPPRKQCRPTATTARAELHLGYGVWTESQAFTTKLYNTGS